VTLSEAERRVVRELAADGASNREIAARLFVSLSTVKFHMVGAMEKVGVRTRTALALWWIRRGQYDDG